MNADGEDLALPNANRDIRVIDQSRSIDRPIGGRALRHFAGVLGLTPWRAEWPRASFSFLKLQSVILPTIRESESSRDRDSMGYSHEVLTQASETNPRDSSERLQVRDLLRESDERVIREHSREEHGLEIVERHRNSATAVETVLDPENEGGQTVRRKPKRSQSEGRPDRRSTRSSTDVETTLQHESATSVESESKGQDSDTASHRRRRVTPDGAEVALSSEARTLQRTVEDDSSGDRGVGREESGLLAQALPEERNQGSRGETAFDASGPAPPTMEPLRTPVGTTSIGRPDGSKGGPATFSDRPSIESPVTDVNRLTPESSAGNTIGDKTSDISPQSNDRATNRVEDELDVERLADRLERVFERKSRIERERRGR